MPAERSVSKMVEDIALVSKKNVPDKVAYKSKKNVVSCHLFFAPLKNISYSCDRENKSNHIEIFYCHHCETETKYVQNPIIFLYGLKHLLKSNVTKSFFVWNFLTF